MTEPVFFQIIHETTTQRVSFTIAGNSFPRFIVPMSSVSAKQQRHDGCGKQGSECKTYQTQKLTLTR
jgi:hypothetical protein